MRMSRHADLPKATPWAAILANVAGVVLASSSSAVLAAQQTAISAVPLVFDEVTVVDVEQGKLVPSQRVVVVGNRIQAVGSSKAIPVPSGAQLVSAREKYLIPGLWDMHYHTQNSSSFVQFEALLAHGVTGIRDPGPNFPFDTLIRWRQDILAGKRAGPPRQVLAHLIQGPNETCERTNAVPRYCVTDENDARHLVDSLKQAGVDEIKLRTVTRDLYFAIAAEARRIGLRFGGHAESVSLQEASDSGAKMVDHLPPHADCFAATPAAIADQCQAAAESFKRYDTWLVSSLVAYGFMDLQSVPGFSRPVRGRLHEVLNHIDARLFFYDSAMRAGSWLRDFKPGQPLSDTLGALRIVRRVGMPLVAGTDLGPTHAIHIELALLVAEGFTPLDALQSATLNPAKSLRATDSLGTVASGKLADLVLLDANPLADITNTTTIRAVVANGRYFDRAALDQLLAETQAKAVADPKTP